jgi:glycosyltransferase involved in cell wall biosynthesis
VNFTIVVPTYNCEKYLDECLQSIAMQKHDGFTQIIVIDNESIDGTLEIAKKYTTEIICEKDKGEPDAINKGMRLAKGDIVAWLDSDDLYEPDVFSHVENIFFFYPEFGWLYGKSHFINEHGQKMRRIITWLKQRLQSNYSYNKLCNLCFISQPSVFMRRKLVNEVGEFNIDYPLIFDYEYWLRVGQITKPFYISEYLSSMRAHNGSNSVKFSTRQMRESLDLVYRFRKNNHYLFYGFRMAILISMILYYKTWGKYI